MLHSQESCIDVDEREGTDVVFKRAGESDRVTHISTDRGAFLQLLEGKKLPGISIILTDNKEGE